MLAEIKKHLTLNNAVLIVALVLALTWAWSTINVMAKNYDLERQVEQARLDNQIRELQNENLKLEQAYYKTSEYLELQARTLLNKAKDGEHLVILPRSNNKSPTTTTKTTLTTEKSNLEQWIDFLFGRTS